MDPPDSQADPMANSGTDPMEEFLQAISYNPLEDSYLSQKYNNPNEHLFARIASTMYASDPPREPESSSPEDEPGDDSDHSWDSDEESLDGEWAEMSKQFSLHGQALEEVAKYKIYFVRCQVRVPGIA